MGEEPHKSFNVQKLFSLHENKSTKFAKTMNTASSLNYEWRIENWFLPSEGTKKSPYFNLPGTKKQWCIQCSQTTFSVVIKEYLRLAYFLSVENNSGEVLGSVFEFLSYKLPEDKCTILENLIPTSDDNLTVKVYITVFDTYNFVTEDRPACNPNNLPLDQSNQLLFDLRNILNSGNFSDIILKSNDGQEIPAHGCLLAARSSVFAAMLSHDMKENKERCIQIDDADSSTIKALLQYMYTGQFDRKVHGKMEIFILADKYDVKDLRELCKSVICNNMTDENVVDVLELAKKYNIVSMQEKAVEFMNNNIKRKINLEFWKNLQSENPSLINELFQLVNKKDSV